jgi:Protein of unknown function (DUF4231)
MGANDPADPLDRIAAIAEDYARPHLQWYLDHKVLPRLLFRAAGVVIIVLSVSIPLLTTLSFAGRDIVLSCAALLIAALTGLNSFYGWDQAWRGRQQTAETLEHLIASWRVRLAGARLEPDPAKRRDLATAAAQELIDKVRAVTSAEAEQFFSEVRLPQIRPK